MWGNNTTTFNERLNFHLLNIDWAERAIIYYIGMMWPISVVLELAWFLFPSPVLRFSAPRDRSEPKREEKDPFARMAAGMCAISHNQERGCCAWPPQTPLTHLSVICISTYRGSAIDLLFPRSQRRIDGNLIPFNGFYRTLPLQSDKTHCDRA